MTFTAFERDDWAVNPDSPETKRRGRRRRWYRTVLIGFVALATIASLSSLWVIYGQPDEETEAVLIDSPGRGLATQTMQQWLASSPSPLPGGIMLSWDGVDLTESVVEGSDDEPYTTEVHHFTLASGTAIFDSTVVVAVAESGGQYVIGDPSLMPRLQPADSDFAEDTWTGYESEQPSSAVADAVDVWADAFASGDPGRLRQVVGDETDNHSYIPLSGVLSAEATVVDAGVPADSGENPDLMLVRVELELTWSLGEAESEGMTSTEPVSYDLLISRPGSAAPRVVSWGPAGTGPMLTPYSVAVEGVADITAPSIQPAGPDAGAETAAPEQTDEPQGDAEDPPAETPDPEPTETPAPSDEEE